MFLLTLSAIFILYSKNPLHAVLGLILVFINSALLLITMNAHFLALIYIVVYVGAICVLFLFVIMLLNLRLTEITNKPLYKNELIPYFFTYFIISIWYIIAYFNQPKITLNTNITQKLHENVETNFIVIFLFENVTTFILLIILLFLAVIAPIGLAKKNN